MFCKDIEKPLSDSPELNRNKRTCILHRCYVVSVVFCSNYEFTT
jgi:hypothetical protein